MAEKKYDPELCITAEELRAMGILVPDNIPDCGWITKEDYLSAMSQMTTDVKTVSRKERTLDVTHLLQLPPFHWALINGTVMI